MADIVDPDITEYVENHSKLETPLLQKVRVFTSQTLPETNMLSGPIVGNFLKMVVQTTGARSILELGTFTGYSSLWMAEGFVDDFCEIITCENSAQNAKFARTFFDQSPHKNKIRIIQGPALDSLDKLVKENKMFDLVFIDADKANYKNYYERVLERVKKGGHIIIDNTLWSGKVMNPQDNQSRTIHLLNQVISRDVRVHSVLLTVRDGIQWIRKK